MRRRDFIGLLGSGSVAWPLVAHAQRAPMPVIGFISDLSLETTAHWLVGFHRALSETGLVEGRDLAIEYRWTKGNYDLLPELAADLVHRQVAVIVTIGSESVTRAMMAATTTIPIIAMVAGDPVKRGLVASVNRPGGNLTVVSLFTSSDNALVAKRVGLVHELVPKATIIGWLADSNILDYDDQMHEFERAVQSLGFKAKVVPVAREGDLDAAFASIVQQGAGALLVTGPIISSRHLRVIALAASGAVPVIYEWNDFVADGGLTSYGAERADLFHQAGVYAVRILKGEKPGDLPVVSPSRFVFAINMKTANALGLAVPPSLLAIADQVLE